MALKKLCELAMAVFQQEGWFEPVNPKKPSIPHTCNNPGNLRWSPDRMKQLGMFHNYVIFLDRFWGAAGGLNDLRAKMLKGLTVRDAINIYCPAGDGANDPTIYVKHVCAWTGADPDKKISEQFEDPGRVDSPWLDFPEAGSTKPF